MSGRRKFIKNAALSGVAASSAALTTPAKAAEEDLKYIDPRKPFKRTSRFKSELVHIGLVDGSRRGRIYHRLQNRIALLGGEI